VEDAGDVDEDAQYFTRAVKNRRPSQQDGARPGAEEMLVSWWGYASDEDTWEPMEELPDPEALWKAHLEQEEKRREAETSGAVTTPSSAKGKDQKTLLGTELPANTSVTTWIPGRGKRCSKNANEWQCKNTAMIDRKWCSRCTAVGKVGKERQRAAKMRTAAPQTEAPPTAEPAAAAHAAPASQAATKPAARIRKIIPTKKDLLGQTVPKKEPPQGKIHRVDPDFGSALTASDRDSQSNCCQVNWKIMGQPCEFQVRGRRLARTACGKSRRRSGSTQMPRPRSHSSRRRRRPSSRR
jgi:hypothetical protein